MKPACRPQYFLARFAPGAFFDCTSWLRQGVRLCKIRVYHAKHVKIADVIMDIYIFCLFTPFWVPDLYRVGEYIKELIRKVVK